MLRPGLACVGAWYVAGLLRAFVPTLRPERMHLANRRPGAQGSAGEGRDGGRAALHAAAPNVPAKVDLLEAKSVLMRWLARTLRVRGHLPKSCIVYSTIGDKSVLKIPALQLGDARVEFSTEVVLPPKPVPPPPPPPDEAPAPPPAPEAAPPDAGPLGMFFSELGDDALEEKAAKGGVTPMKVYNKVRQNALRNAERELALEALQALPAMLREMPNETLDELRRQALVLKYEGEPKARPKEANQTMQALRTEPAAGESEEASAVPKERSPKKKKKKKEKAAPTETARPMAMEADLTTATVLSRLDESETADFVVKQEFLFTSLKALVALPGRVSAHAQFLLPEDYEWPGGPDAEYVVRFARCEPVAPFDAGVDTPRAKRPTNVTSFVDTYREQLADSEEPVTFVMKPKDTLMFKRVANATLALQASFMAENRTVKVLPRYEVIEVDDFKTFAVVVSLSVD